MKKRLVTLIFLAALASLIATSSAASPELGDHSDGSRAVPVHFINLLDEQGQKVSPADDRPQPFSLRKTCGLCHSYETVASGWHFNATDANVPPGRPGQFWIYADPAAATQLPVSYRPWPNTFRPQKLGISPWQFTLLFARHTPGGAAGEMESDVPDEIMRQFISGKLEINCLACHNAAPAQNQPEYARQVQNQNLRWAATAASGLASVKGQASRQGDTYDPLTGSAISVKYEQGIFGSADRVLLDITRQVPNNRCYFCHSNTDVDPARPERWMADEDVHLAAGMRCVDCHRHGIDHNITRGYEGEEAASKNPLAAVSTCRGCHLGTDHSPPDTGRLGAPRPSHNGIPTIHFEKLTCTACHSGPWPAQETIRTKTSRAHLLGLFNSKRNDDALPHIIYPVFARRHAIGAAYAGGLLTLAGQGKLAPHKLIWPAFWAVMKDGKVEPIDIKTVKATVPPLLSRASRRSSDDWPRLSKDDIAAVLKAFAADTTLQAEAVYIAGGTLYRLDDSGNLVAEPDHPAAQPSMWPIAHNVRPAQQSLGVGGCKDCHTTGAPFVFGKVEVDSPVAQSPLSNKIMADFQNRKPSYMKAFAMSFVFRPWLKLVALLSCAAVAAVLLFYGLKALGCIVRFLAETS